MSDLLQRAQRILELEQRAIAQIPLDGNLIAAVQLILGCKGKVVTSGMGKAGIIAQKVAATFSSTGTPSVFLHPGEAQHGDLGMIGVDDVLLVMSNSGRTRECLELITLTDRLFKQEVHQISITSNLDSPLAEASTIALSIGRVEEACPLGLAPTSSTTAMLALGDVLCMLVMEERGFGHDDFYKRHHGGYLGSTRG